MTKLVVRLDPRRLDNPDADIRYLIPDMLAERSAGVISDDGYDYVGEQSRRGSPGNTSGSCGTASSGEAETGTGT
jgi:hypothetical protein